MRIKDKLLIMILMILSALPSTGQKVFVSACCGENLIREFDIQTCDFREVCYHIYNGQETEIITITPGGEFYGSRGFHYEIFSVDTNTCYMDKVGWLRHYYGTTDVESDESGNIWMAYVDLIKFFPATKKFVNYGKIPDTIPVGNGTLMKRFGDYYYISNRGGLYDLNKLVKLDTAAPMQSKVLYTFPDSMNVDVMFSIRNSCDEYTTYVFYYVFTNWPYHTTHRFAELDFDTKETYYICDIGKIRRSTSVAVPWGILDSDCNLIVDLDLDNSSGAKRKNDYIANAHCYYDGVYLSDIDPEVYSGSRIDSVDVFFAGFSPDGPEEFLYIPDYGGLNIEWHSGQKATLINKTPYNFNSLEIALRNIQYRNISDQPTPGERKIGFVAYSKQLVSDTAYAHILIEEDYPVAGRDTLIELCYDDPPVYLNDLLSQGASSKGEWLNSTSFHGIFDPKKDAEGIYPYVVVKQGCDPDTANVMIIVHDLPEFDLGTDTTICSGEEIILKCNLQDVECRWQDGNSGKLYEVRDSGRYILDVWDTYGCHFADSIHIGYFNDSNRYMEIDTQLCQGITIQWNEMQVDSAGDYRIHADNINGCDSITVLHVKYFPEINTMLTGDKYICEGGNTILGAGEFENYQWSTGEKSREIEVESPGLYRLTVTDKNGCIAEDSILVKNAPVVEIDYQEISEKCYGEGNGKLELSGIRGGVGGVKLYFAGEKIEPDANITGLSPGRYVLKSVDSLGCENQIKIQIDSAAQINVDLGHDLTVSTYDTVIYVKAQYNITEYKEILWYINGELTDEAADEIELTIDEDKQIIVLLIANNGCEVRDTLNITVDFRANIYIPDIFTPDGDGINDVWRLRYKDYKPLIKEAAIFDRWGEKIILRKNISNLEWDGTFKGKRVSPGVYLYYIRYENAKGYDIVLTGDITVIR